MRREKTAKEFCPSSRVQHWPREDIPCSIFLKKLLFAAVSPSNAWPLPYKASFILKRKVDLAELAYG